MRSTASLTRSGYAQQAFSQGAALVARLVCRLCSRVKRARAALTFFLAGLLLAGSTAPLARHVKRALVDVARDVGAA
jgi:hypothetical protein